ncbi:hypothetical protein [Dyadobacter sp. CY351]|uniref:hypothetical protein n=1 Tax=Dyadobacter sp. CY351 TaxID=2909337 RepID=UPI001F24BD9B|nr:hypothetical protein [Dyadobacter sp. CY351]MCF2518575.1 hypothetical protein [Dyadobacter sp. CY351]
MNRPSQEDALCYPIKEASKLQALVEKDNIDAEYDIVDALCDGVSEACPFREDPQMQTDIQCNFDSILITKAGRKFDYEWNVQSGVKADVNGDTDTYIEVVAGDSKEAEIVLRKKGLVGPCEGGKNHKGKSWDIETFNSVPDDECRLMVLARQTKYNEVAHFLPYKLQPSSYTVRANSCHSKHELSIKCYSDAELTVSGAFTLYKSSTEKDRIFGAENEKKVHRNKRELNFEVKRNSAQVLKFNVFEKETVTREKFARNENDAPESTIPLNEQIKGHVSEEAAAILEHINIIKEYDKILDTGMQVFQSLFKEFNKCSRIPLAWEVTFLKTNVNVSAKWVEVPESRRCNYEVAGSIEFSPLISVKFEADFSNTLSYIPFLGPYLGLAGGVLKALNAGEIALKLEVLGSIGMSSDRFILNDSQVPSKLNNSQITVKAMGEVGATIRLYATIKIWTPEFFGISCGGETHMELGVKAKLTDTESVLRELSSYYAKTMSEEQKTALEMQFSAPESKQWWLGFSDGKLMFKTKIGFTGLAIYTKTHAQGGCATTITDVEVPASMQKQAVKDYKMAKENAPKSDFSKKWGGEEEEILCLKGASPLIWQPEFNFFGNS